MLIDHALRGAIRLFHLRGFTSHFARTEGGRLHYLCLRGTGKRPCLVLMHGIGSSGISFGKVAVTLRDQFSRIIIVDSPGHGRSEVPRSGLSPDTLFAGVEEALDSALSEPFYLLGNSLGGAVTLRYASTPRRWLTGAIVTSPGGAPMTEPELRHLIQSFQLSSRADGQAFVARVFSERPWHSPLSGAVVRALLERPPVQQFLASTKTSHMFEPGSLKQIPVPLLFVWGKRENLLAPHHRAFFERELPEHTQFEFPEEYGHIPQVEHWRDLSARIVRFVDRTEKGSTN